MASIRPISITSVFLALQLLINFNFNSVHFSSVISLVSAGNFTVDFDIIEYGNGRAKILNNGESVALSLDKESGSGFESKNKYLFGNFHMQLKLVPGNSTGTATTYYLTSNGSKWDEIDFGFYGNLSGEFYVLITNVVIQGSGNREQQFYLWFDPTTEFHTYSILWNPNRIMFAVDGSPIRLFKNLTSMEIPYPNTQSMKLYGSIYSVDNETDWNEAPFVATFKNFDAAESCHLTLSANNNVTESPCGGDGSETPMWLSEEIDTATKERVKWVQDNYMVYSYCSDADRFPDGLPPECDVTY